METTDWAPPIPNWKEGDDRISAPADDGHKLAELDHALHLRVILTGRGIGEADQQGVHDAGEHHDGETSRPSGKTCRLSRSILRGSRPRSLLLRSHQESCSMKSFP